MIPLFEYDGRPWTFLGLPMSQNRLAVPIWSYAIEQYPPKIIVEIGTNNGGFTVALGIAAWRNGGSVHSFDVNQSPNQDFLPLTNVLPIVFHKLDCFGDDAVRLIADFLKFPFRAYLLCDGGNKPKEFNLLAQYLKIGDVIAAHDYSAKEEYWPWSEITQEDVAETVIDNGLKPFMQEHFDMAGWLTYRKEI